MLEDHLAGHHWDLAHPQHLHPSSQPWAGGLQLITTGAVNQIFEDAWNDPTISLLVENLDPDDQILSPPTCRIWQGVHDQQCDNHLCAHHQAIQLRDKLGTQDMRQFSLRKNWLDHQQQRIKICSDPLDSTNHYTTVWVLVAVYNGTHDDNTI